MRSTIVYRGLALVALYGCASTPAYRSSSVVPPASFRGTTDSDGTTPGRYVTSAPSPAGSAPADSGVSVTYWEQLGDSTLSRLVGEVLRSNLDVRSARARVSAARSDRVRSVLDLTPSATARPVTPGNGCPRRASPVRSAYSPTRTCGTRA
jgi:outer membrane protein TolC